MFIRSINIDLFISFSSVMYLLSSNYILYYHTGVTSFAFKMKKNMHISAYRLIFFISY